MFILVTGGARSGRRNYALRRAAELGPPPWLYVTGERETDAAIRKRVERTRRDNEAIWRTGTLSPDLTQVTDAVLSDGVGALVLDGLVAWLTERLITTASADEGALIQEIEAFADRLSRAAVPALVVTQELGQGIPPAPGTPEHRLLRLISQANHILALEASGLVMMVSGLPLRVR